MTFMMYPYQVSRHVAVRDQSVVRRPVSPACMSSRETCVSEMPASYAL